MSSTRDAMVKPNSPSMKSTSAAVCSAETALRQNSSASPRKNCSYQFLCICFLRILDRNVGETERRSTPVSGQKSEGLVSGRRNYSYAEITITRLTFSMPAFTGRDLPDVAAVKIRCSNEAISDFGIPLILTQYPADAPSGTNGSGAPPGESAPWVPSTGTC